MRQMIFDGHNDSLLRLWVTDGDPVAHFATDAGQVNAPNCRSGGMGGGFFAIFAPQKRAPFSFSNFKPEKILGPLPPPLDEGAAAVAAFGQAAIARRLHGAGLIEIVTDAGSLERAFGGDSIACVLHLEGADCIGEDLLALDALHALGLRSLGPVWSRPTIFGEGVPFGFDRDGDTGPGLTEHGRRLVERSRDLGIIIDTSHMTTRGFFDVGDLGLPLVATHSNATAVCNTTRNLTDDQLRAVGQTGGMAGLNFGTVFLDPSAWSDGRCGMDACVRQLAHMVEVAGEDHIGFGSDFDGMHTPDEIASAADLPALVAAMEDAGFGAPLIGKICNGNWRAFLARHFGSG